MYCITTGLPNSNFLSVIFHENSLDISLHNRKALISKCFKEVQVQIVDSGPKICISYLGNLKLSKNYK